MDKSIDARNHEAICQTLIHQGERMEKLELEMQSLLTQVVKLGQELQEQRGLIVRSLQNKYGHGSTSGE